MDELLQPGMTATTKAETALPWREGMSFVAENPEAFGFISDACPVATDRWLIAANGRESETGVASFTYPASGGLAGLYESIYPQILTSEPLTDAMLERTFGAGDDRHEHPVARYVAALAEGVTLQVLSGIRDTTDQEEIAYRLGTRLPGALDRLRENLCRDGLTARDAELYTVSMAVCRMIDAGGGSHVLDFFVAGDYRAYLLDANGLRPIRLPRALPISPESAAMPMSGKRVRLSHPSPFAVLLLSESACALNAAEEQTLREEPGLVWRYRMRLEKRILRIMTACVRETEFGARAAHYFSGRACGRDSAAGAVAFFGGTGDFASFRAGCLTRLRHLEDMIALLPDGYDPATVPRLPSRTETELTYISRLLAQEQGLAGRTAEALLSLALHKLKEPDGASVPPPEDIPDYRRLSREDVLTAFRVYDAENDGDHACIRRNSAALREQMADHWVTLRPILMDTLTALTEDDTDSEAAEPRVHDACDRAYEAVLGLNARLGELWDRRHRCMEDVMVELSEQSAVLRAQGPDWLHGRAGNDQAVAWADEAAHSLYTALQRFSATYEATETGYRSLLSAYMSERDLLFSRDAERESGFFAGEWSAILHGTLSESRWAAYRTAIAEETDNDVYLDLWDDLHVISRGTGARYEQIHSRAADVRMARDIASRPEFRIAALRGAAYRDPDWGEAVCDLLDAAHHNSYFTVVRRWQETCELMARQAEAYEEYRRLYESELK